MGGKESFVLGVEGSSSLGGRQRRGSEVGSLRVSPLVLGLHSLGELLTRPSEKAGCYGRSIGSRAKAQNPIGSPSARNIRTAARNGSRTLDTLRRTSSFGTEPLGFMNCLGRWGGGALRIYIVLPAILRGRSLPHSNLI